MKPKTITTPRILLALLIIGITLGLVSWDFKQPQGRYIPGRTDTIPKSNREKKIRDLDDVLDEVNTAELKMNMDKVRQEIEEAMKQIDGKKLRMEIDKALREVDMEKIRKEVEESVAKIDWDKMKAELDQVKNLNMDELNAGLKKMEEELQKIGPEIEREIGRAKIEMEKAKGEMKEYRDFVNDLDRDGLINKKEPYSIRHKDGELTINGKKAPAQVYSKYRLFLEKHKKFTIEKSDDDFDLDMD